ncbi:MAG: RNA-binding S4 domain-containing protein [Oscillospiraceae bacterium]|nr:RNA-binding S4 domain-containing protein [Oscillospiraceae bacterium]
METIAITTEFIKLEQFLKLASAVSSGGEAKLLIQNGGVRVNGEICLMRGKKLYGGEEVTAGQGKFNVAKTINKE